MKFSLPALVVGLAFAVLMQPNLSATPADHTISLAGKWAVKLDPESVAESQGWPNGPLKTMLSASLPGSLTTNGIGDQVTLATPWMGDTSRGGWATEKRYEPYRQPGNIKIPFWLQPDTYYRGKAWFQREIRIPDGWLGKRVVLELERCH